jgi:lysophospholipase L1-like esterase
VLCRFTESLDALTGRLRKFCKPQPMVTFLSANDAFLLRGGGRLIAERMPDALHPSADGEAAMDGIRSAFVAGLLAAPQRTAEESATRRQLRQRCA